MASESALSFAAGATLRLATSQGSPEDRRHIFIQVVIALPRELLLTNIRLHVLLGFARESLGVFAVPSVMPVLA